MASSFSSAFRSFWHAMTSNDRHSTYDSPYRSGRHVPLSSHQGHGAFTSVATAASESRADVSSPYGDDNGRNSSSMFDTSYQGGGVPSPMGPLSPRISRPYSPGMRSLSARSNNGDGFETASPAGEIPMQSFHDGLPPAPPVSHSWSRIDNWAEDNYPELYDQLGEGATTNDLNELEHMLDCSLPNEVRESLQIHDGQERGGTPTGIIFGSMLLDCEEIVQERENWRKVNQEFLLETAVAKPSVPSKALGGSSSSGQASSSRAGSVSSQQERNATWRQDLLERQVSVPPNAIQKAYAHSAWIPLVRDWGGNNLAVDLAPGPAGTWGQVIMFGRDYDTKYVVARSWSAFLALVADDLNSGKWFIDDDSGELKLREFKSTRVEPGYFDILRWRMDQKYGRRQAKRKSVVPGGAASPTGSQSPYASPTDLNGEARGRSLQRLSSNSPLSSPIRPAYSKSSPLARVAEETPTSTATPATTTPALELTIPNPVKSLPKEKLVEVETPRPSGDENLAPQLNERLTALTNGEALENGAKNNAADVGSAPAPKLNGSAKKVEHQEEGDGMKTIEI